MKLSKTKKTHLINILAEFLGSAIYSFMYFIAIGRFLSPQFNIGFVETSFAIGFAYFIAVYIPFHTYRIHLIPFISLIRALLKKSWRIVLHKLPAQFAGALVGVGLMRFFLRITGDEVDFADMWTVMITDPYLEVLSNVVAIYTVCYLFSIIRLLFQSNRFTSKFFFAFSLAIIFFLVGRISGIWALNPFGYLANALFNGLSVNDNWGWVILAHVVMPLLTVLFTFFLIKDNYIEHDKEQEPLKEIP